MKQQQQYSNQVPETIMSAENSCIIGWQKNSFIDFPGTVSTVLFFSGCNLRCPYCHNPDIVQKRLPPIPFSEIAAFLEKRKKMISGVVLSGGEPTIHPVLPEIVKKIRSIGYKIKLDTNGLNPDMIAPCNPDYCALDIKTTTDNYAALGCKLSDAQSRLHKSIEIIKSMGECGEVRITAADPFVNDDNISAIAETLRGVSRVYIQKLVRKGNMLCAEKLSECDIVPEKLEHYRSIIASTVGQCVIRGE